MDILVVQILNGLTAGAEIALIAAGLALIFGVLEIVNFAHGEFYMISSFNLYILMARYNLPYFLAAPLAVVLTAICGIIFYLVVIRRVLNKPWQVQLVATLALSIVLINLAIVLSGPTPRYVESPLNNYTLEFGGGFVSAQRLLVLVGTLLAFSGLYWLLKFTKQGKAMRAVAQNREAAAAVGISVTSVGMLTTVVACSLGGVAGVLIAPLYIVSPTMAVLVIVKAFAAVIVGGFGNVTGAIIAAFIIGFVEAFATAFISAEYATAIVFAVMILVLLVRPNGLFGMVARVG